MPVFPLNFGQMADALGLVHAIAGDRQAAFASRLKNLQRLALLPEINTGKGRKAEYGVGETLTLALALEFLQLGVTPEVVVDFVRIHRDQVLQELKRALGNRERRFMEKSSLIYFDPCALYGLQDEDSQKAIYGEKAGAVYLGESSDLTKFFTRHPNAPPRLAVIDMARMMHAVVGALAARLDDGGESSMIQEFVDWAFGTVETVYQKRLRLQRDG